jgi:predicted transcriptional regulator
VRLDWEYVYKLERLAQLRGLDRSKLIRMIIVQYLDSQLSEKESMPEGVKDVLDKSVKAMETVVDYVVKYCEDHAKEIVERQPHENYQYWRNRCLEGKRWWAREKMLEIIRKADKQLETFMPSYDQRREHIKTLYQKIDQYMSKLRP